MQSIAKRLAKLESASRPQHPAADPRWSAAVMLDPIERQARIEALLARPDLSQIVDHIQQNEPDSPLASWLGRQPGDRAALLFHLDWLVDCGPAGVDQDRALELHKRVRGCHIQSV